MKITVISGASDNCYLQHEEAISQAYIDKGNSVQMFRVRDLNISYCSGCWACWVKTPGRCIQQDDMPQLLKSIINSDATVFMSPVRMGFVSSLIKKVNDKMIPLIHPYIDIFGGECHHIKRYAKYPKLGLVLLGENIGGESHQIITQVYRRMAINFKTELAFSLACSSVEDVQHAVSHI